jgi:hypothetical protein
MAPSIAPLQDNIPPNNQPNNQAFEKVIIKAGRGAAMDWNIISNSDITGAHAPKDLIYSFIVPISSMVNSDVSFFAVSFTCGTYK